MSRKKEEAFLLDTHTTIDFCKVYLITLSKGMSKGTTLRFDTGTKKVEVVKGKRFYDNK